MEIGYRAPKHSNAGTGRDYNDCAWRPSPKTRRDRCLPLCKGQGSGTVQVVQFRDGSGTRGASMDAGSTDLRTAQILWTLGFLLPSALPEVATKGLIAGLDTPSLRSLAGSQGEESATLDNLFEQALSDAGLARMTRA